MQSPISRNEKAQRTQWAAQFLAASELVRQYYVVSFTMGNNTPDADLMVGTQGGKQFWVDVKGLSKNNAWLIKKKHERLNLYYVLVRVGEVRDEDRFFILPQSEMNKLLDKSKLERRCCTIRSIALICVVGCFWLRRGPPPAN